MAISPRSTQRGRPSSLFTLGVAFCLMPNRPLWPGCVRAWCPIAAGYDLGHMARLKRGVFIVTGAPAYCLDVPGTPFWEELGWALQTLQSS